MPLDRSSLPEEVLEYELNTPSLSDDTVVHIRNDASARLSSSENKEYWKRDTQFGVKEGGQGEVSLQNCVDGPRRGDQRVVKRIRTQDGDTKRRYISELRTFVIFSRDKYSQNFVKTLGWYLSKDHLYITMEYCAAGDLGTYLDANPLAEDEAREIDIQIVHGLAAMHSENFAHRDIKPSNILIVRHPTNGDPSTWWVKLGGFGISKEGQAVTNSKRSNIRSSEYFAPELAALDDSVLHVDYQSADMWALGAMTFFMLTKALPFNQQDLFELEKNLDSLFLNQALKRHQINMECQAFIRALLQPKPEERLASKDAKTHPWILSAIPSERLIPDNCSEPVDVLANPGSEIDSVDEWVELSTPSSKSSYHLVANPTIRSTLREINTFRVKGVPLAWDELRLSSFITHLYSSANPRIHSLATDFNGQRRTATVSFGNVPSNLRKLSDSDHWEQSVQEDPLRSSYITLDKGFLGFTTLYAPPPHDCKIDVIAVHGLGGYAFESFKESDGDYMWLRDSLASELTFNNRNMARVLTYGYETNIPDDTRRIRSLDDIATFLATSLRKLASETAVRPIIFVAHSLGGLIVQETVRMLSQSTKDSDQRLVRVIRGIAFFGVPRDTININSFIPTIEDGLARFNIESIGTIHTEVLNIQRRGSSIAQWSPSEPEVIWFHEEVESPTAQKHYNGIWTMNGPKTILVAKSAAASHGLSEDEPEHTCTINRTHLDMVKFKVCDQERDKVIQTLKGLAQLAFQNARLYDLKKRNEHNGSTLLHEVATWGCVEALQLLLDRRNVDVSAVNCDKETPLHTAARGGHLGVVQLLLDEMRADPNAREKNGWTPLHKASKFAYADVVQLLLERGSHVNAGNNIGFTALHFAAKHGHTEVVQILLQRDANVEIKDKWSWTPLHEASEYGHLNVARMLIENGAGVNAQNFRGTRPLLAAVRNGHVAVAMLLLQSGAEVEAKGNTGKTALDAAIEGGHTALVQILRGSL